MTAEREMLRRMYKVTGFTESRTFTIIPPTFKLSVKDLFRVLLNKLVKAWHSIRG